MEEAPGTNVIRKKIHELYTQAEEKNCVDTAVIFNELEPLFKGHGYRSHVEGDPLKILMLHDDGVGDFINCSPAIREVRRAYPQAYITLMVPAQSHAMATTCPYVDQILVDYRECNGKDPLDLFRWYGQLAEQLLPMHYDLAFLFSVYGNAILLAYLSGSVYRISFELKDGGLSGPFHGEFMRGFVTDQVPNRARGTHAVYHYLPLVEYLTKKEVENLHPEIWTLAQETEKWQQEFRKVAPDASWIAVVIGSSMGRRHWPADAYAALLNAILKEETQDVHFLILGGPGDKEEGDTIIKALPEHKAWNAVGKTNYRESAAALCCCKLYIGNDTGLMHAAAASGLPVLSPCCYPADVTMCYDAVPIVHYPYGVPTVFVRPAHALPGCQHPEEHADVRWGCVSEEAHCIKQVTPTLMLRGYFLLKKQIEKGKRDVLYLYEMENPTHDGTVLAIEPRNVERFRWFPKDMK